MAVQRIVPAFQGIDDATAALILQLLLQDSEELAASGAKGKDRAGTSASDSELAVLLYQQELKKSEQFVNDRQVAAHLDPLGTITYNGLEQARRIKAARIPVTANAIVRALITTVAKEENDKGPSLTFSSTIAKAAASCPSPEKLSSNASSSGSSTQSDDTFKTSKTSIVSQSNSNSVKNAEINQQVAESSAWAASRNTSNKGKEKVTRCCVCYEDIPTYDVVDLSCEDHYCRDCLQQLFSHSFKDLTLFPPRCCKNELTPEIVGLLLTSDLIREFEERKLEYDTTDKIYCANSTCSAFLKKEHIDTTSNAAFCPACWTETCTLCKSPAHEGLCPEDETTKMILALAEKNHWKQCSSCKAMVEISFGCNHMRCRCGTEWCYPCGTPWKHCKCALWTENNLLIRATAIADREAPMPGVSRDEQINAIKANLRGQHCEHDVNWTYEKGTGQQCENCEVQMERFVMQCGGCSVRWCKRCMKNRTR